jgi:hypothetical protein
MAEKTYAEVFVERNGVLVKAKAVVEKGSPVKVTNVKTQ